MLEFISREMFRISPKKALVGSGLYMTVLCVNTPLTRKILAQIPDEPSKITISVETIQNGAIFTAWNNYLDNYKVSRMVQSLLHG
jgi:hypothetical protein